MPLETVKILNAFETYTKERDAEGGRNFAAPLATEDKNPLTEGLAENAQAKLDVAFDQCTTVDKECLAALRSDSVIKEVEKLSASFKDALNKGKSIYIVGCGASGRLAMVAKNICREALGDQVEKVQVIMAGGDKALVSAIERFEDNEEYGKRQLLQAGYQPGDCVVGVTASGDAPFVQRIIDYANEQNKTILSNSACKPVLVISNPVDQVLARNPQHPIRKIESVETVAVATGSPALSGSSRMQPSTTLLMALVIGMQQAMADAPNMATCLSETAEKLGGALASLSDSQKRILQRLTELEAEVYKHGERVYYQIGERAKPHALGVITDIVERSPTFTVPKVVPTGQPDDATAYLFLPGVGCSAAEVMKTILGREPNCLNWAEEEETASEFFAGYDFSEKGKIDREARFTKLGKASHVFAIDIATEKERDYFTFCWDGDEGNIFKLDIDGFSLLEREVMLKMLLNTHSTLLMGRNKKFSNNLMRRVNPTNAKLIGRAIKLAKLHFADMQGDWSSEFDESFYMQVMRVGEHVEGVDEVFEHLKQGLFCSKYFYPHEPAKGTTANSVANALIDPQYGLCSHASIFQAKQPGVAKDDMALCRPT